MGEGEEREERVPLRRFVAWFCRLREVFLGRLGRGS